MPILNQGESGHIFKINIIIFALTLLTAIASFYPNWGLWGLDIAGALPVWLRLTFILILFVAILPPVSERIGLYLEQTVSEISDKKFKTIYLIFMILAIGLFILFSSRNYFLGDGYNVMGHLTGGYYFSPTEPLDYLLHIAVAKALGGGEAAAVRSYQICAYLAGALFLGGIYLFLRNKRDIIIALAFASSFGVMLFFFGYVESYTFRFVLMFLYAMSAAGDFRNRKVSAITILLLAAAIGFHLSSLVLAPSLLYLIWNKYRTKKVIYISVGAGVLLLLAAAADILLLMPIKILAVFTPLVPTAVNPYHLFSSDHLYDMLNGFLLCAPLIILPLIGIRPDKGRSLWWWATLLAPALLFAMVIDPRLGAFRDWDLLSIAAGPLIVYLIFSFTERPQQAYRVIIPIIIFSLLHTGGWIWWNRDRDQAYQRIKEIVHEDKHYSKDYYGGYGNKAWSIIVGKFSGDHAEVVRAEEVRFAGDPADTLNACNLAYSYLDNGDSTRAVEFVRGNWRRYLPDIGAVSSMGSLMFTLGQYHDTERMYETYLAEVGKDYRLMQDLGAVKEALGKTDEAMSLYDQAFIFWKNAPIENELAFYLKAVNMKYYDIAKSGLERIYPAIPDKLRSEVALLIDAIDKNNSANADSISSKITKSNPAIK